MHGREGNEKERQRTVVRESVRERLGTHRSERQQDQPQKRPPPPPRRKASSRSFHVGYPRPLLSSLKMSDTKVYALEVRAFLDLSMLAIDGPC